MDGLLEKLLIDPTTDHRFASSDVAEQRTIKQRIDCIGVGLHTGQKISLSLRPAPVNHGIVFRRTDLGLDIPARYDLVSDTRLCTVIGAAGASVGTVEHLVAALAACEIDNVLVELNGPEVPVLDGSSQEFVFLVDCAGSVAQNAPRHVIEVLRTVRVEDGDAFAEIRPNDAGAGLDISLSIAFAAAAIGRQALSLTVTPESFRAELARARTFTQASEVAGLQAAGLALGGSLHNAVVVDGAKILNPGGLRMENEFVRHKMLDVYGDLALAGAPICARLKAHKTGHRLNNRLLRTLFADQAAWRFTGPADAQPWLAAA